MSIFIEAAEVVFRSQLEIYGAEKMTSIANASGWNLDASLRLVSVEDEETAFRNFWQTVRRDLGNAALVNSKLALIRFIAETEQSGARLESDAREHFMKEIFG